MRRERLIARREELGMTQEQLAEALGVAVSTVARTERGESTPLPRYRGSYATALDVSPEHLADLLLGEARAPDLDAADRAWAMVPAPALDDVEALELVRRAEASDVGPATVAGIERAVDRLCRSYSSSLPADLHGTLAAYGSYVGRLLDGRATLGQRRDLMVFAGWLSLLAAVEDVDLHRHRAAGANLDAVRFLGAESGHPVLLAWAHEVEAWQAITDGDYRRAIVSCRAGRTSAGADASALVQLSVQEARAHARLGNARDTYRLLDDAATALGNMPPADHPEHHFVFDPRKHVAYTATTLAWLGDDDGVAEEHCRQAVEQYADTRSADGRWVRRLATARIDLALVLARSGEPSEASHLGTLALDSGRLVPSNVWRVTELDRVLGSRYRRVDEVDDFHDRYVDARRDILDDTPQLNR